MTYSPFEEVEVALGELQREMSVRKRIFPRWVEDGRMTPLESKERLERLSLAIRLLKKLLDLQPGPVESTGKGDLQGTVSEGGTDRQPGKLPDADSPKDDVPF